MSTATTAAPTLQSPVPVRAEDVQPRGYEPPAGALLICPETQRLPAGGTVDGDR
jgi:hypothetical protein